MLGIRTVETPSLGDRSYVAHDGTYAVVIDPQRDTDRVLELTEPLGLSITHVLETHVHNDYVTGGLALAREVGADYCLNAADPVRFDRLGLRDGDLLHAGSLEVEAVATPGHTFTHLAYVVRSRADDPTRTAVFSGGSLLNGSTGRTDLVGAEHTEELARHQHASARRLVNAAPAGAQLCPTHGFGSFCSAGGSGATGTCVGDQAVGNPALLLERDAFVAQTVAGLGPYPTYYRYMSPRNLSGPAPPPREVVAVGLAGVRRRLAAAEPVVDVRPRADYAAAHLPGSINIGFDGSLATWAGWLLPYGVRLTVVGADGAQLDAARRELVRIGMDRVEGLLVDPGRRRAGAPIASYPMAGFADLGRRLGQPDPPLVLDVRLPDEHRRTRVRGSVSVPLPELAGRLGELPKRREVWVHCGVGYRAAIGASVLAGVGFPVVLIDGELELAAGVGVPMAA